MLQTSDYSTIRCHHRMKLLVNLIHVFMKQNRFFNILKVQHFKDTIPKFGTCLKKIVDFIPPENCAILLSKMVFELCGQNVLMT